MAETPTPSGERQILNIQIYVLILVVTAIGLFGLIWLVLGELGATGATRLFASLCLPPGIIALLIGIYVLLRDENKLEKGN
jgi:lipopolysaccharide export LptBFGC system permease protein LptF